MSVRALARDDTYREFFSNGTPMYVLMHLATKFRPIVGWAELSLEVQRDTGPDMCLPVDVALMLVKFGDALDGAVDQMEEAVEGERQRAVARAAR